MANRIYIWKGGQLKQTIQEVLANFDINDYCFNTPYNWYRLSKQGNIYNVNLSNTIPTNKDIVVFGNPPIKPGEYLDDTYRKAAIAPCLFGGWSGDQHRGTFRGGYTGWQTLQFDAGTTSEGTTFTSYFSEVIVDSHGILSLSTPDIPSQELPAGQPSGRARYHTFGYGVSLSQGFTWASGGHGPLLGGGLGKNSLMGIMFIKDNFPSVYQAGITTDPNNIGGYTGSFFDTQNNSFNQLRIKSNKYTIFNLGYTASAYIDIETVPNLSPFGNTYPVAGYTGSLTGLYAPVIKSVFNSNTSRFLAVKNGKFKSMTLRPSFYRDAPYNTYSRWSEYIKDTSIETLSSHDYNSAFIGVTLGEAAFYTDIGSGFGMVGPSGSNQYRVVYLQGNQNKLDIFQEHYPGITASDTNRGSIDITETNYLSTDTYLEPGDDNKRTYELALISSDCFRDNTNAAFSYSQLFDENSIYYRLATTVAYGKYPVYYIGNATNDVSYPTSNIERLNITAETIHPVKVNVANVNINTANVLDNCVLQITDIGDTNVTTRIGSTIMSPFGSLDLTQAESNPNHNIYFGVQGVTSVSGGISSRSYNGALAGGIIRTNSNEKLYNINAKLANTYVGPNDEIVFISQVPPVTTTKK